MFKNINQKLTGKDTVNIDTCTHIFVQADLFLNNDQSSGFHLTHIKTCLNQFVYGFVIKTLLHFPSGIKWNDRGNDLLLSKLFQCTPQLRLKNYDHTDHKDIGQISEYPQDRIHLKYIGYKDKCKDYQNTFQECISPCKLDPGHKLIYKKGNQSNFNNVYHANSRQCDLSDISAKNRQNILHSLLLSS